jgi:hypothetical protein
VLVRSSQSGPGARARENAPGCGSGGVLRSRRPLSGAASGRIVALRPSHALPRARRRIRW